MTSWTSSRCVPIRGIVVPRRDPAGRGLPLARRSWVNLRRRTVGQRVSRSTTSFQVPSFGRFLMMTIVDCAHGLALPRLMPSGYGVIGNIAFPCASRRRRNKKPAGEVASARLSFRRPEWPGMLPPRCVVAAAPIGGRPFNLLLPVCESIIHH